MIGNPLVQLPKGHQTLAISRKYWCFMRRKFYVKNRCVIRLDTTVLTLECKLNICYTISRKSQLISVGIISNSIFNFFQHELDTTATARRTSTKKILNKKHKAHVSRTCILKLCTLSKLSCAKQFNNYYCEITKFA